MADSPQQAFIKQTKTDVTRVNNAITALRQEVIDIQKQSKSKKYSDVPTADLTLLRNRYLRTGVEGKKITRALDRLDSVWTLSPDKLKSAPAAIKKREYHKTLRTNYESILRGIGDELDNRD